jgi:hypothetical protein
MLTKVRLEIARCPEFPEGSAKHGYLLTLPLDESGALETGHGQHVASRCHFERFWNGEQLEVGHIERHGHGWTLAFDGVEDDAAAREPIFKAEGHRFLPGDYLSIKERDGQLRTFRVAATWASPS